MLWPNQQRLPIPHVRVDVNLPSGSEQGEPSESFDVAWVTGNLSQGAQLEVQLHRRGKSPEVDDLDPVDLCAVEVDVMAQLLRDSQLRSKKQAQPSENEKRSRYRACDGDSKRVERDQPTPTSGC